MSGCLEATLYTVSDNTPYVYKRVALVVAKSSASIDPSLLKATTKKVEQRLEAFPEFSQFLSIAESDRRYGENTELKYQSVQYTRTFALTGISDKNISSQIGNALQADQLFIIQADRIICTECDAGQQLMLKFYLIETQTSRLLWRGRIHQKLDMEEIEEDAFATLVMDATDVLLNEFEATFKVRWHRQRYENLKKLSTLRQ